MAKLTVDEWRELNDRLYWESVRSLDASRNGSDEQKALLDRLKNYPEMQTVWQILLEWSQEDVERVPAYYAMVPSQLSRYAMHFIGSRRPVNVLRPAARKEKTESIAKAAKVILREFSALDLPLSIFRYIPFENTEALVIDILSLYGYDPRTDVLTVIEKDEYEPEDPDWELACQSDFDHCIDCLFWNGHVGSHDSALSVRDIFEQLTDAEYLQALMPPTDVYRATSETRLRLALIRNFVSWLKRWFGRDARNERELIACFARTVLDDASIDESTVKDALKNFDLDRAMPLGD